MAETYLKSYAVIPGIGKPITLVRRSLVNPGNHTTPTPYYVFGRKQSMRVGSFKNVTLTDANNPVINSPTLCYQYGPGLLFNFEGDPDQWKFPGKPPLSHPRFGELKDRIIQRLISEVQDANSSDFNASVFLAEARTSLDMITNSATRIYLAQRALRKGDLKGMYRSLGVQPKRRRLPPPKSVTANMSNYWLEATYGWSPLLSDAYNGAVKIAKMVLDEEPIVDVRSRFTLRSEQKTIVRSEPSQVSVYELSTLSGEMLISWKYGSHTIAQAASLGLTNPGLLAWEVLPLSFVIDWFLPVGNFLESLSAFHGLKFQSGYFSTKLTASTAVIESGYRSNLEWGYFDGAFRWIRYHESTGSGYTLREWSHVREVLLDFPTVSFPKLSKSPLSFEKSLDKTLSALSLLRQRL